MSNLDNQPLRYWRGNAVYLCAYLTIGLAVGLVFTFLLASARFPAGLLAFSPPLFLHGAVWQPFTYVFLNEIDFFTVMGLLCFYQWGVEVEKYLGRKTFLGLCAALVLVPVLFNLSLYELGRPPGFVAGYFYVIAGLLVAFATLYPNLDYFFGWIPLKWFAFVMIVCGSLRFFPEHDWSQLFLLWLDCAVGFVVVRYTRGWFDFQFRLPAWLRGGPKLRVMPRPEADDYAPAPVSKAEGEMNALLDKIARQGIESLTPAERRRLEKAREEMLRKEK